MDEMPRYPELSCCDERERLRLELAKCLKTYVDSGYDFAKPAQQNYSRITAECDARSCPHTTHSNPLTRSDSPVTTQKVLTTRRLWAIVSRIREVWCLGRVVRHWIAKIVAGLAGKGLRAPLQQDYSRVERNSE